MTVHDLKTKFKEELAAQYSASEIAELYSIFAQKVLDLNRMNLRNAQEQLLTEAQQTEFENILAELKTGKPYQQITQEAEFFGLQFFVNENVLIPRPETEELLELAISEVRKSHLNSISKGQLKILDIGTGSGVIPIVLKKNFPSADVSAIDYSEKALEVARRNLAEHKTEIQFIHADYLNEELNQKYDVIISNPPYIGINEESEIEDSVKGFEPTMALFSPNENALVFYEKIAKDCKNDLSPGGLVFLEINQKLGPETAELFKNILTEVFLVKDISGNDRFVWGRK